MRVDYTLFYAKNKEKETKDATLYVWKFLISKSSRIYTFSRIFLNNFGFLIS